MNDGGACSSCGERLGWAEPDPCGSCNGIARWRAAATDRLYQVLCRLSVRPAKVTDLHRVAEDESAEGISHYAYAAGTAKVYVPQDPRFCWAGQGLYGLARDGLLPGPRNLAGAAALVLCAAQGPQTPERIEFVMKRMGYRFHLASLVNAMRRTAWFARAGWGEWDVQRGPRIQHRYRVGIDPTWPPRRFDRDMEELAGRVELLLAERTRLWLTPPDLSHLEPGWEPRRP